MAPSFGWLAIKPARPMLFLFSRGRPLHVFPAADDLTFVMAPSLVGADDVSIHGFHHQIRDFSVMQRHRFTEAIIFRDRLAHEAEAERLRRKALTTPTGKERQALLRKARQIETAADIDKWLSSPGLQAPQ